MFDTACSMLDSVYNKQYDRVTGYITEEIKLRAGKGLTECTIQPSIWSDDCPLVSSEEVVSELNLKGYTAEVKGDNIVISWDGVERNCLFHSYIKRMTKSDHKQQ